MRGQILSALSLAAAALGAAMLVTGCEPTYGHMNKVVSTTDNELTMSDESGMEQETHEVAADAKITLDGAEAALIDLDQGDSVSVTVEEREGKEVATEIKAVSKEKAAAEAESVPPQQFDNPAEPLTPQPGFDPAPQQLEFPAEPTTPEQIDNPATPITPQPEIDPAPGPELTPLPGFEPQVDPEEGAPPAALEDAGEADEEKSLQGDISSVGDEQIVVKDDIEMEHTIMVNDDTEYTLNGEPAAFGDLAAGQSVDVAAMMEDGNYVAMKVAATSE